MEPPNVETKAEEAGYSASRPNTGKTVVDHNDEEKGAEDASTQQPTNSSTGSGDAPGSFTIPDGGWRAWLVVLGSFLVLFSTFGYVSPHSICTASIGSD